MGWWAIGNEGGGIDWDNLGKGGMANHWPGEDKPEQMMMGDGPADMMSEALTILTTDRKFITAMLKRALDAVVGEYENDWNRKPFKQELIACFNFCQVPEAYRKIWDELIKDFK